MSSQIGSNLHNSDGGSRLSKRRSCIIDGIVRDDLSFPAYETRTRITASAPALPVVETEKPSIKEVSEDHDLKCPICLEIVQGACETSCGHCFCAKCLISYFGRAYECPMCRQKIEFVHPSFVIRRMVETKYPEQAADLHKKQKQKILDDNLRMAFSLRRGLSKEIHVLQHRSSAPEHHKHSNVIVVAILVLVMLPTIFWICHNNFTSGSKLQPAQKNQQRSKPASGRVPATSTIQVPSQQPPTVEQQLVLAAGKGDVPTIQSLIKAGVNPSCKPPPLLSSPLWVAAANGSIGAVEALVSLGADVNGLGREMSVTEIDGKDVPSSSEAELKWMPPLGIAAMRGHSKVVQFLIENHADINPALRFNALHLATIRGDEETVGILLENGIVTDAVLERGETAMSIACMEKQEKPTLVDLFLKYGVPPPSTYSPSLSPIIQGVERVVCTITPSNDGVVGTTITMNTVSTLKELSVRIQKAYAMAVTAITHSGQRFSIDLANSKGRTKALPTLQALLMQQSSCTGSLLQECPGLPKPYKLSFHVSLKELPPKSPFRKSG